MPKKEHTILIVDDVSVNRMTIKLSLREDHYTFLEADNGEEAIALALEHHPDVILMDAMMPVMDGFEATKRIREIEEIWRIPILMITALEAKDDKIKALQCGVSDFISKPFDKTELQARCRSYVQISTLNSRYTLATQNPITHLPNKLALQQEIDLYFENRGLYLIKIDNFNEIENFYGNQIVPAIENNFIEMLREHFQIQSLKIYHIGSGKYGLLIDNTHHITQEKIDGYALDFIEKIKHNEMKAGSNRLNLSLTISFASHSPTLYEDANEVLTHALINKKEYLVASQVIKTLRESLKMNLEMLDMIKYALKHDGFVPHFQPIFDNKTKTIYKYETLIRMKDNEGNLVYPGPYLMDVAKKGRLYPQVTKLIMNHVVDMIRTHHKEFSINLSSLDIENPQMGAFLLDLIKKNSDITQYLIFELLEDKDTEDYSVVKQFIDIAKGYGAQIAIDDFGSGYSNFMRILEFEPDIIKIDGSLIQDIATNKYARNTVEMIKVFADRIGAKTVAEYVENEEIYNIINEIGIDYSQGYYIAKATVDLLDEKRFEEVSV